MFTWGVPEGWIWNWKCTAEKGIPFIFALSQSALSLSCSVPLFRSCLALSLLHCPCHVLFLSYSLHVLLCPCPVSTITFSGNFRFSSASPIREATPTCSHHHLSRAISGSNHSRLFHANSAAFVSGLLHLYHLIKPTAFCPWPWASPTFWVLTQLPPEPLLSDEFALFDVCLTHWASWKLLDCYLLTDLRPPLFGSSSLQPSSSLLHASYPCPSKDHKVRPCSFVYQLGLLHTWQT